MSQKERDTHFAGFAKAFIQKVDEKNRAKAQFTGHYLDEEELHLLVTQFAYDVVDHTITALWPYINDTAIDPSPADIPDFTE